MMNSSISKLLDSWSYFRVICLDIVYGGFSYYILSSSGLELNDIPFGLHHFSAI